MSNTTGFPEAIAPAVSQFALQHETSIRCRDVLLGGKSGAYVCLVDCKGKIDGIFVLKLSETSKEYDSEPVRHQRALSQENLVEKMPRIIAFTIIDDFSVVLMGIAGDSLIDWRPLAQAYNAFSSSYGQVGEALTPSQPSLSEFEMDGKDVVARWLSYRLDVKRGGRILEHAADILRDAPNIAWYFSIEQLNLPNPIAFALADFPWNVKVCPALGPMHGDLHGDNVFHRTSVSGESIDIRLIDFAFYEDCMPMFFDHAYLEISTLIKIWDNVSARTWLNSCQRLHRFDSRPDPHLQAEQKAWLDAVLEGRTMACTRIQSCFPNRRDDLRIQFQLAQVAAGLAFIHKKRRRDAMPGTGGLSHQQHAMALIWAATALQGIIDWIPNFAQPLWNSTSIPRLVYRPSSQSMNTPNTFDAQLVDNLRRDAFRILLLGSAPIDDETMRLTTQVSWNLVLDFSTHRRSDNIADQSVWPVRTAWPGQALPDTLQMRAGTYWYHVNGRSDISEAKPELTGKDWRRKYISQLDQLLRHIRQKVAPKHVEVLHLPLGIDASAWNSVVERLDTEFSSSLLSMKVVETQAPSWPEDVDLIRLPLELVHHMLERSTASRSTRTSNEILMPHRTGNDVTLRAIDPAMCRRIQRDLQLANAQSISEVPIGRKLGYDFLRGFPIAWAELDRAIDVPREAYTKILEKVMSGLRESKNATVNLFHHPSAGGTTLARRILWDTRTSFPSLCIEQVSNDTAQYLREVFQATRLPILAVLETTVTDTEKEQLLVQLREDNTRVVFLRVARSSGYNEVTIEAKLNDSEAARFYETYVRYVDDPIRRQSLIKLRDSRGEERSPFFFGLTAFGVEYVGLDNLVSEVVGLPPTQRQPLELLALTSLYTPTGIPSQEWEDYGPQSSSESALRYFILNDGKNVRVPHILIARKMLERASRKPDVWKADLAIWANKFLDFACNLPSRDSERVHRVIESMFVTRDTTSALEGDVGTIQSQRRFAALISDIGNVAAARGLLKRLMNTWPDRPHYAVHYIRHLLYEVPQELDEALNRANFALGSSVGGTDNTVFHIRGMCYRIQVEHVLSAAMSSRASVQATTEEIRPAFEAAIEDFQQATALNPSGEHSFVATIQLVHTVLSKLSSLSNCTLDALVPKLPAWCKGMMPMVEAIIEDLRNRPGVTDKARNTMREWDGLFRSRIDSTIGALRHAARQHEDPEVRRTLCDLLLKKHDRLWHRLPVADLQTVVLMMERNLSRTDFRDHDMRRWMGAYRSLPNFDVSSCIEKLHDWQLLRPASHEPMFYLFVFYIVRWLGGQTRAATFAEEANRWLSACKVHRPPGSRSWSYEWLVHRSTGPMVAHFRSFSVDPLDELRQDANAFRRRSEVALGLKRISGTIVNYLGPQQATVDLGSGVIARITPRNQFTLDDVGARVEVLLSFGYDGLQGWDPLRIKT